MNVQTPFAVVLFDVDGTLVDAGGAGRRALRRLPDDPLHLLQLLHERRLGVQPAGGVADDHVGAVLRAALHRLEADARRVAALYDTGESVVGSTGGRS